jgi:hypothetical protein
MLARKLATAICAMLAATTTLAGCGSQATHSDIAESETEATDTGDIERNISGIASNLSDLSERVSLLEAAQSTDSATVKPGDNGKFNPVHTALGSITFSFVSASAFASGSRVRLRIGNPLNADIAKLSATILYGSLGADGSPAGQPRQLAWSTSEIMPAGSWHDITINLDGVPPQQLGYVTLNGVSADSVMLNQPPPTSPLAGAQ